MKKIFGLILGLVLSCFVATSVFAEGYISTSATSQVELSPDVATFSVQIVTTSKDSMTKAIEENKKISSKVYDNLKKSLDKSKSDYLKTSKFSAVPMYKYNNNKKVLEYYQVTNTVNVRTTQIDKIGRMVDTALADGATSVNNISYDVLNYDAECNKLLAQTSLKAKEQAKNIANGLSTEITGVKSIETSCSMSSKTNVSALYSARTISFTAVSTEEANTNIEAGTMTLYAKVNATFFVK